MVIPDLAAPQEKFIEAVERAMRYAADTSGIIRYTAWG